MCFGPELAAASAAADAVSVPSLAVAAGETAGTGWGSSIIPWLQANSVPLAIGGQVLGIALRNKANQDTLEKRSQYLTAEQQRQSGFQEQANAALNKVTPQFTPEAQAAEQAKLAVAREQTIKPSAPGDYSAPVADQPEVVKSEVARRMVQAIQKGKQTASALAGVGAYGDLNTQNAINLSRSGSDLGRIGRASAGSLDVIPSELESANLYTDRGIRTAADVSSGLGNIAMMYSLTRPAPKPAPKVI